LRLRAAPGDRGRSEGAMNITLTDHDVEVLRDLLQDLLPDLKREIARTERYELRHRLVERQNLVERILGEMLQPVR
jgi:hypothetical protein